jgi:hypothetical protein
MSADLVEFELVVATCSEVGILDGQTFVDFTTTQTVVETDEDVHYEDRPSCHRHWGVEAPYVPGQVVTVIVPLLL